MSGTFQYELNLEKRLRQWAWLIPFISISTGFLLLIGIFACMELFRQGHYWIVFVSGLFAHAFFIVIVHDGAHKSITKTKLDRFLMNLGGACMLLPFYGEPFRKYHLLHHGNTNTELDPLWPEMKKSLYGNKRWFYILCECIPLLFTFYLVFKSDKKNKKKTVHGPKVNKIYIALSVLITAGIIYFIQPSLWFFLGSIFTLNLFSTLRHWCEHLGKDKNLSSNTFWFPLGMGIGNHDAHHDSPHVSWIVLMLGLLKRKKTTSPIKTLWGVLFDSSFVHYQHERIEELERN
jgi:fatty acid desaturase